MDYDLQHISRILPIPLVIGLTIMLLGSYGSLRTQRQLIANYENQVNSISQTNTQDRQLADFTISQYHLSIAAYNASLDQFPDIIVARICGFTPKSPSR